MIEPMYIFHAFTNTNELCALLFLVFKKWPRKHVKIYNDTLIECRAFNSAGEEKASAYLSVEPGEWNLPPSSEVGNPFRYLWILLTFRSGCSCFLAAWNVHFTLCWPLDVMHFLIPFFEPMDELEIHTVFEYKLHHETNAVARWQF